MKPDEILESLRDFTERERIEFPPRAPDAKPVSDYEPIHKYALDLKNGAKPETAAEDLFTALCKDVLGFQPTRLPLQKLSIQRPEESLRRSFHLDRHAIMAGLLQSHDERFGFRINHRLARIDAGKFLHRVHRIEPEQRNEFHFIAIFADEQFRAAIAVNFLSGYARKNFVVQQYFVCLRVCAICPPMPNPRDHMSLRAAW